MSQTFSVVICCYTVDRWQQVREAVESAKAQVYEPVEVIVSCDHNPELYARCRDAWQADPLVRVIENRYPGRLGSARNSAVEVALGDVVAFLDDDARAEPDWLQKLAEVYAEDACIQAVGGAPTPIFHSPRPAWFPLEFDWVFGCAYRGLPTKRSKTPRLIGACMSARRAAVVDIAGFHSDNHDDMDLCHRLATRFGNHAVVFDPQIQVRHNVTAERVSWAYFWRRCLHVNRGKVLAIADMGEAGGNEADLAFVRFAFVHAIPEYLRSPLTGGWRRAGATVGGIACAAVGSLLGRFALILGMTAPSATRGLIADRDHSAPVVAS